MKSLLRKTIFWSLVIGIIITAIAFFVFYIPLGLELEKRALDVFETLSQKKFNTYITSPRRVLTELRVYQVEQK